MVWLHVGRMHWVSKDVANFLLEVKIVDGVSHYRAIDEETGEILKDEQYQHPLDAMASASKVTNE